MSIDKDSSFVEPEADMKYAYDYNTIAFFQHNETKPKYVMIYELKPDVFTLHFKLFIDGQFWEVRTVRGGSKYYKSIKAVYADILRVFGDVGINDVYLTVIPYSDIPY